MNEENKFVKDEADPQGDFDTLNDVFNVTMESNQIIDVNTGEVIGDGALDEVNQMRKELKELEDDLPDVDGIILDNIERANSILDKVQEGILAGNYTASLVEACGKLIDSVTSAANSITGMSYNSEVLRQKERDLDRKDRELAIKGIVKGDGNVNVTNNTLVMSREELLKMIKDEG